MVFPFIEEEMRKLHYSDANKIREPAHVQLIGQHGSLTARFGVPLLKFSMTLIQPLRCWTPCKGRSAPLCFLDLPLRSWRDIQVCA
jgi:hypothetical protein